MLLQKYYAKIKKKGNKKKVLRFIKIIYEKKRHCRLKKETEKKKKKESKMACGRDEANPGHSRRNLN